MSEFLYSWEHLSSNDLHNLLNNYPVRWLYLENDFDIQLTRYQDNLDFSVFPIGRAFDLQHELRWQMIFPGSYAVQLLTETEQPEIQGQSFETEDSYIHLWGQHIKALQDGHYLRGQVEGHVWIETRIPRPLQYPLDRFSERVALRVRHYRDNALLVTTRWLDFEGARQYE